MLRWICRNTRQDSIRSDKIRESWGSVYLANMVRTRLRWSEHIEKRHFRVG